MISLSSTILRSSCTIKGLIHTVVRGASPTFFPNEAVVAVIAVVGVAQPPAAVFELEKFMAVPALMARTV